MALFCKANEESDDELQLHLGLLQHHDLNFAMMLPFLLIDFNIPSGSEC